MIMVHLVKGGDFMIKVREFYDMRDYSKKNKKILDKLKESD